MLSPKARFDAIPSVLVSADDVPPRTAAPSASSTRPSIFYMASRGLDRPSAVGCSWRAFSSRCSAELEDEPLEELVRAKIAAKLAAAREDIEAYATADEELALGR